MREIEFRGKQIDTNKWVYGYYYELKGTAYIIEKGTGFFDIDCGEEIFGTAYCHEVVPETVGQYTGLKDKNSKKIYMGDIIECRGKYNDAHFQSEVLWDEDATGFIFQDDKCRSCVAMDAISKGGIYTCEVIGNIHDNAELLKGVE